MKDANVKIFCKNINIKKLLFLIKIRNGGVVLSD